MVPFKNSPVATHCSWNRTLNDLCLKETCMYGLAPAYFSLLTLNLVCPSLVAQMVKNLAAMQGSVPGLGRSLGEGNGNPFQYSCLENSMDRGACWAKVHGVTKSWTRLSDFRFLSLCHLRFSRNRFHEILK